MKTIKYITTSIAATIYFGLATVNLFWWGGLAGVLLSLQMICNAFYVKEAQISIILFVGAGFSLFFGSWLMLKNKRK